MDIESSLVFNANTYKDESLPFTQKQIVQQRLKRRQEQQKRRQQKQLKQIEQNKKN